MQQFVQILEVSSQFTVEFGKKRCTQQLSGGFVVPLPQRACQLEGALAIAAAGGLAHGKQGIGHLGHGTDYHHRTIGQPAFDDLRHSLDRFRILN